MRYTEIRRIAALDIWHEYSPMRTQVLNSAISQLRARAMFPGVDKRAVAAACLLHGVKRRVPKRWSISLLREALPRSARMTGPVLQSKTWRSR